MFLTVPSKLRVGEEVLSENHKRNRIWNSSQPKCRIEDMEQQALHPGRTHEEPNTEKTLHFSSRASMEAK